MGEFLQSSSYIFDDLNHQEVMDNYAAEILAASDVAHESNDDTSVYDTESDL